MPTDIVDYRENSWIQSPCFDFSEVKRPFIQMEIMRSFIPEKSGAVLQYQDVIEDGWKTIGELTAGVSWYNSFDLEFEPGGSSIGWGLNVFNPDTEWVMASHDLNEVLGKSNVKFRIAIAAGAQGSIDNQGFAFDNIYIAERSKLAVLEHFTQFFKQSCKIFG